MARVIRKRIGEILIDAGVLTDNQIQDALTNRRPNEKIGETLIRLGYITESQILDALQTITGLPRISLQQYDIKEEVVKLVPEEYAVSKRVIPIDLNGKRLVIAMNDPLDYFTIDDLRVMTGYNIDVVLALNSDIDTAISKYYGYSKTLEALGVTAVEYDADDESTRFQEEDQANNPIVQLVDQILLSAVLQNASDIHVDPQETSVKIRYRVDGVLHVERVLPTNIYPKIVSRIKVMSNLDITESRVPQDGRIKLRIAGRSLDLRIATLPVVHGEKIVMRLLDLNSSFGDLNKIGLSNEDYDKLMELIERPNGIVLVSGPTGSGKSTTLYGCLRYLNNEEDNIITVEDPVEIQIEGVNQVQVRPEVELTFAAALRSILRQDPNIIMVGEIRDDVTAEISVRSALTGHLVLSTIHTNDAVTTITRLVDIGIEPFLVGASLAGVISQRLVRKLCTECSTWDTPTKSERELFEQNNLEIKRIKRAVGCPTCNMRGYIGRTGIFEILTITEEIRRLISENANVIDLKNLAISQGTKTLLFAALEKVKEGITTIEEVMRAASTD